MGASSPPEIDAAFATLAERRPKALLVASDPFLNNRRDQIVALAARHVLPASYEVREYVLAGGLMSYGNSLGDYCRQFGVYTGRLLKGAKPADLPVAWPSKVELVVNRGTAEALGLEVPPSLLARADEVIGQPAARRRPSRGAAPVAGRSGRFRAREFHTRSLYHTHVAAARRGGRVAFQTRRR